MFGNKRSCSHTNHRPVLRENSIRLLGSSKLYIQLELRIVTPIVIACRVKQTIDHSDLDTHSACHSWEQHRSSTSCCPTLIHSVNNMVYAVYAINNCQIFFTHAHARRQYYNNYMEPLAHTESLWSPFYQFVGKKSYSIMRWIVYIIQVWWLVLWAAA